MKWFLLVQLAVLMVLPSCKLTNSATKSLGNLGRDDNKLSEQNQCRGDNQEFFDFYWEKGNIVVEDTSRADQLKDTIRESLGAVPQGLQSWYFAKGGKIVLTENAAAKCGEPASQKLEIPADKLGAYHSCYHMAASSSNESQFPVLYMNANADLARAKLAVDGMGDLDAIKADINHSMVRMFGYLFAGVISKLTLAEGGQHFVFDGRGDPQLKTAKEQLAFYYLMDIARSKDNNMGVYRELLTDEHKGLLAPIKDWKGVNNEWRERWMSYQKFSASKDPKVAAKADFFKDVVFAEAFDSYYCNAESRATITKKGQEGKLHQDLAYGLTGYAFTSKIIPGVEEILKEVKLPEVIEDEGKAAEQTMTVDNNDQQEEVKAPTTATTTPVVEGLALSGGPGLALTRWRFPILRGVLRTVGFVARGAGRVLGVRAYRSNGRWHARTGGTPLRNWAQNRRARVNASIVPGQPLRNIFRIVNGGNLGWRAKAVRRNGGLFRGGVVRAMRKGFSRRR